ncbi:MAG: hypothetical protein GXZ09_02240 [Syntrophomonadaceae bacterium]|jgi:NTE family protein|nr:hypothetical protein [Syntrophomonadaceae bacterium]
MKKLGLALGGGGLKGLAHIGVLQVLQENGIKPSFISGTSAGSIVAALYACGIDPQQMAELVKQLKPSDYLDYNISGLIMYVLGLLWPGRHWPLQGIIRGCRLERLIYKWTGGLTLNQVKMPTAIIACDINSGQEVVFCNRRIPTGKRAVKVVHKARLSEAVRCSTSIPATFVPRKFGDMLMVDGGLRSMVPVWVQVAMGAPYILAIDLGQEQYYSEVNEIPALISRSLEILTYETSVMDEQLYADMVVFPALGNIGLNDIDKADWIIAQGRQVMERRIEELIRALSA